MTARQLLSTTAAIALVAVGLTACGDDTPSPTSNASETGAAAAPAETGYGPAAAKAVAAVPGDAKLLDVREQDEWDAGHAEDAILFMLGRIEAGELPPLGKDEKIFVYCRSGRRAQIAVDAMQAAGYTDVTNIGGLEDWQAAGGALAS